MTSLMLLLALLSPTAQAEREAAFPIVSVQGLYESESWSDDGLVSMQDVTDSKPAKQGTFAECLRGFRARPNLSTYNVCLAAVTNSDQAEALRLALMALLVGKGYRRDLALAGLVKLNARAMKQSGGPRNRRGVDAINAFASRFYAVLQPLLPEIKRPDAPLYLAVAYADSILGSTDGKYRGTLRAIVDRSKPSPRLWLFVARYMLSPYEPTDHTTARRYWERAASQMNGEVWVDYLRIFILTSGGNRAGGKQAARALAQRRDAPAWMKKACSRFAASSHLEPYFMVGEDIWRGK